MSGNRLREITILAVALAAALAGSVVALGGRDADSGFIFEQLHPAVLTPAQVERAVRTAPDPRTATGVGTSAACRSTGRPPLRNPWRCVVRYGSRSVPIDVRVAEDGSYTGVYEGGGRVRGCCVPSPIR